MDDVTIYRKKGGSMSQSGEPTLNDAKREILGFFLSLSKDRFLPMEISRICNRLHYDETLISAALELMADRQQIEIRQHIDHSQGYVTYKKGMNITHFFQRWNFEFRVTALGLELYEELIQRMQKDQSTFTKQPTSLAQEADAIAASEAKTAPVILISYTHEDEEHKAWVRNLAERLRADGVDVILDQWDLRPGQDVLAFMERRIRQADRVLLILTPEYRRKANDRIGGVGYESLVITGQLSSNLGTAKFIGLLRRGDWSDSVPTFILSRYHIDFRDDAAIEKAYEELLRDVHETPAHPKPPLGKNPFSIESPSSRSKVLPNV